MIATCTKSFSQKIYGRIFKVPLFYEGVVFRKINTAPQWLNLDLESFFFVLSFYVVFHALKVKQSLILGSGQQMHPRLH